MWNESSPRSPPDPGGEPSSSGGGASAAGQLHDLKEENEQQKLLIAQLKGMLRKEQSTVTQEKLEEYVNTLSKVKAKKSRAKKSGDGEKSERTVSMDSGKMGKINLLRQQMEENKAKLAERGKNQKGIEEMVTQLKAQLNDSQQMIQSSPLSYALPDNKNLEYTRETSQEELFNILLVKEKQITDLLNKVQKQEATVLDLQENLKEKDSVIDARTKAITLMTDSLSKRSKDSLDALDETREQMRKMQENFVLLENDMKARQMKLLSDLKAKNLEISELNEKLQTQYGSEGSDEIVRELKLELDLVKQEKEKHVNEKLELNKKLEEALSDIEKLKSDGSANDSKDEGEVAKLKKQLDDSNKNMIKIKAQSKSKIKELTKKIEAFKKISDTNVLIVQLQNENTKLSEKIAELEEEKGNMQLKMVESTESAIENVRQDTKEFEEKISQYVIELEEKDKIITLLEADILSSKVEMNSLKEKIANLPHLESPQVSSEMKNVQIEEELEKLEKENEALKQELESVNQQNGELQDKINDLLKEKQELNGKLESYIQENMELIDKLEKLSAEKVSSAESIEIVEGLTTQEKLELAAYQKHIDPNLEESKLPEEDPQIELSESVIQLSEDSAELLNKIEMFNTERKEVMGKMEALKEENSALSLKIAEIENSRDVLVDTYEQLQSEKEELQQQNENLLKQVEDMKNSDGTNVADHDLGSKLQELQAAYERLVEENDNLKSTIKQLDGDIHEKHNLDKELHDARAKIVELETKLETNKEELTNYQNIIEENRNELINSSVVINELQNKLDARENEIKELNVLVNDLNKVVATLQNENEKLGRFEPLEAQMEELKTALEKQMEQAQDYAEEAARNNDVIDELNHKLEEMHQKILDAEHDVEVKNIELDGLKKELLAKEDVIRSLQDEISEKDDKIKLIGTEMKDKYLALQKQLDGNNGSLEKQIEDLSNKNKEQLEKMKKIAANFKKKTQAYQELEAKYIADQEKWETELHRKETDQLNLITQVKELKEEINSKTVKLEEAENRIKELLAVEQELQVTVADLRRKQEKINEVSLKQELSTSLHEEFEQGWGNNESVNDEKIRELELIIETNEADLNHYRDRLQKLEQELSRSVEDRDMLQSQLMQLQENLNQTSQSINEKMLREASLEQKLEQVSANDEFLEKKLREVTEENNELSLKIKEQEELINKLKIKIKKAHEKMTQLKAAQQNVEELEAVNNEMRQQLAHFEAVQKHIQEENEVLHRRNQSDYEKIEADYQGQLEELLRNKNELLVDCEKLREDVKSFKEREEELLGEIKEYKTRILELDSNEDNLQKQSDELSSLTEKLAASQKEVEDLNLQIENLKKELLVKAASAAVEEIVSEAKHRVYDLMTKETQTDFMAESSGPSENIPEIKWAYNDNNQFDVFNQQQPAGALSDIESQIVDFTDAANTNQAELRKLEFESVDPSLGEQGVPVVEEMVKPKQAYLTYQPGVAEAFGENDDGWGWGPEEAKLEEEHQVRAEHMPQVQSLRAQLAQAVEKVQVLQMERENHLEEIKQLQVKSGKLIKKYKELKAQNDRLVQQGKRSSDGDFNLDDTIQEELKAQIDQLEKRIKEITVELEKEKSEKGNILKRVDVLTAANERMVENKEIQDAEVFRWKRKYEEVEEKLRQTEWGTDGFNEQSNVKNQNQGGTIADLQKTIKELSLDNEELQALLNEQRDLRIQAERSSKIDPGELSLVLDLGEKMKLMQDELTVSNSELQSVMEKKNKAIDKLEKLLGEKTTMIESLEEELINLQESNNIEMVKIYRANAEKVQELTKTIQDLEELNAHLKGNILKQESEIAELKSQMDRIIPENNSQEFAAQIAQLMTEKEQLECVLLEKESALEHLKNEVQLSSQRQNEIEYLKTQLVTNEELRLQLENIVMEKDSTINQLKGTCDQLSAFQSQGDVEDLRQQLSQLEETKIQLETVANEKDAALNKLKLAYDEYVNLVESLNEQNQNLNSEMQQLKEKYDSLERENVEHAEDFKNQLNNQKQSFEAELNEINKKYDLLQQENHELRFGVEIASSSNDEKRRFEQLLLEKENQLKQTKEQLENEIEKINAELQNKQKDYNLLVQQMEEELHKQAVEFEDKLVAQVDERGAQVAESWKNHLVMVEEQFENVQKQLKNEINELEAKCNILVSENNELRKNVDAEIRNEVDKMSTLQQSIQTLNDSLNQKEQENTVLKQQLAALTEAEKTLSEKDREIASLKLIAEATQQQFEEKREVVEEVVRILERNSLWPIGCEKQDVLNELERQLNMINAKQVEIDQLGEQIQSLQSSHEIVVEKEKEILKLKDLLQDLERSNNEKYLKIVDLERTVNEFQNHAQTVEFNDQEIAKLQGIIEKYKVQLEQFQQTVITLQTENDNLKGSIEHYKLEVDGLKQAHFNLEESLRTKNEEIHLLNEQLQKANDNKEVERLQKAIELLKNDNAAFNQSLADKNQELFDARQELSNKINELERVTAQLNYSQQNVEILETEINKLKTTMQLKEQEFAIAYDNLQKTRLTELETHYEELLNAKDSDNNVLKSQLAESMQNLQMLHDNLQVETALKNELEDKNLQTMQNLQMMNEQLQTETALKKELEDKNLQLEQKISELTALLEEEEKQLAELRAIIEEQVGKIETMKDELFEKSKDYDSLVAEMDIGRKSEAGSSENAGAEASAGPSSVSLMKFEEDDLTDPVNRAELDLALYMLHQRDVRCEELTVELTQLLEERDTLQLRLSNALREKEEIRRKLTGSDSDVQSTPAAEDPGTSTGSKSSAIFLAASGTELATDPLNISGPTRGVQDLASKLSELRKVGYKRDKTFVDEQQQRRLQQMSIMQQHISEASKLPPEAAARLVDASYTLSRDVQSPSKVLLNWLWGKSTPKQYDT